MIFFCVLNCSELGNKTAAEKVFMKISQMVGSFQQVICWQPRTSGGKMETDTRKSVKESKARLRYARSLSSNYQPLQVWTADPCHGGPKETNTGQILCNLPVCVRTVGPHMGLSTKPNQTSCIKWTWWPRRPRKGSAPSSAQWPWPPSTQAPAKQMWRQERAFFSPLFRIGC